MLYKDPRDNIFHISCLISLGIILGLIFTNIIISNPKSLYFLQAIDRRKGSLINLLFRRSTKLNSHKISGYQLKTWKYKNANDKWSRDEKIVRSESIINTSNTIFLVMDPWGNWPDSFINKYHNKIVINKIKPLLERSAAQGYKTIFMTVDCNVRDFSCGVHKNLTKLKNSKIIYHNKNTVYSITSYFRSMNIDNIVFTGFSSNYCLLSRPASMINMKNKGFNIFFVDEASAATEFQDGWEKGNAHKAITQTIGLWIARVLPYDSLMEVLK